MALPKRVEEGCCPFYRVCVTLVFELYIECGQVAAVCCTVACSSFAGSSARVDDWQGVSSGKKRTDGQAIQQ